MGVVPAGSGRETDRITDHRFLAALRLQELDGLEDGDDTRHEPLALERGAGVGDLRLATLAVDEEVDAEIAALFGIVDLREAAAQVVEMGLDRAVEGRLRGVVVRPAADV